MSSNLRVLFPVENLPSHQMTPPKSTAESPKSIEKAASLNSDLQDDFLAPVVPSAQTSTPASSQFTQADNLDALTSLALSANDSVLPSGVPVVKLQVDSVTDEIASRLAISLLGHVLFLKNQVPLPVPQLTRLSSTKSTNSRGAKQRAELLASFDTLTSHLTSTFAALSSALYKSCSPEKLEKLDQENRSLLDCAYLAVVLGPSIGTAKSRTFMAVDSFEAKLKALGEGSNENALKGRSLKHGANIISLGGDDTEDERDSESVAAPEDSEDEGISSAEEPEDSEEDDASSDSESDEEFIPQSLPPPPPRISFVYRDPPSLQTPPPKPRVSSPQTSPAKPREPLRPSPLKPRKSLPLSPFNLRPISQPSFASTSFAEEQRFLQNTERLMSRVLAAADTEGYGFANEMAPTQAHVLIRAPRSFSHPAWIPRQNFTASMESSLQDFLMKSRARKEEQESTNVKRSLGKKKQQSSEGVWITAKAGLHIPESLAPQTEEDEMIWWSWDGRIVGFSEW